MLLTEVTKVTSMSDTGEPLEPESACATYNNQCGAVVRDNVEITWKDWKKVPDESKNNCWEKLRSKFRYPEGTNEDAAKHYALQTMEKLWRNWKSELNVKYVKNELTPFKDYGKITHDQWDEFVALKTSEEEKAKS